LVASVLRGDGLASAIGGQSDSHQGGVGRTIIGRNNGHLIDTAGALTTSGGSLSTNPFLANNAATANSPDLFGGAEAYGMAVNVDPTTAGLPNVDALRDRGVLAYLARLEDGPAGYDD